MEAIEKKIRTERITKENIYWIWQKNKDRGIDYDIRKDEFETAKKQHIEAFAKFIDEHIKGKNFTFLILGKKDELYMDALSKLGIIEELSLEEVFGY